MIQYFIPLGKLSILAYCIILLNACGNSIPLNETDAQKFERLCRQQLETGEQYNDTYLGFRFGMEVEEYNALCQKLVHGKVLGDPVDSEGAKGVMFGFPHTYKLNGYYLNSFVQIDHPDGKVRTVDIFLQGYGQQEVFKDLTEVFTKQYGQPTMQNPSQCSWIKGNRHILVGDRRRIYKDVYQIRYEDLRGKFKEGN